MIDVNQGLKVNIPFSAGTAFIDWLNERNLRIQYDFAYIQINFSNNTWIYWFRDRNEALLIKLRFGWQMSQLNSNYKYTVVMPRHNRHNFIDYADQQDWQYGVDYRCTFHNLADDQWAFAFNDIDKAILIKMMFGET